MPGIGTIIAFFFSPIGRYVLIGVIALVALGGVRQSGYNAAKRKCELAAQQRAMEIMQKDRQIGELLDQQDKKIGLTLDKQKEIDDAVQSKLEAELAKRPPGNRCDLTEPDARRLR